MKNLIFNADDLGLSKLTDDGIIECAKKGVVKSASLMILSPIARGSYQSAIKNNISVGLHLDVTTFCEKSLAKKTINAKSGVTTLNNQELNLIIQEFQKQFDLYFAFFKKPPDHINFHHPLYFIPGLTTKFKEWVTKINIPTRYFRDLGEINLVHPDYTEFGFFEKENLATNYLIKLIDKLPDGITEIMTHPGMLDTKLECVYVKERPIQVKTLTDPKLKTYLYKNNINIIDYSYFNHA